MPGSVRLLPLKDARALGGGEMPSNGILSLFTLLNVALFRACLYITLSRTEGNPHHVDVGPASRRCGVLPEGGGESPSVWAFPLYSPPSRAAVCAVERHMHFHWLTLTFYIWSSLPG